MTIGKRDKSIIIPGWALLVGLIVVDNIAVNICKTITNKQLIDQYCKEK